MQCARTLHLTNSKVGIHKMTSCWKQRPRRKDEEKEQHTECPELRGRNLSLFGKVAKKMTGAWRRPSVYTLCGRPPASPAQMCLCLCGAAILTAGLRMLPANSGGRRRGHHSAGRNQPLVLSYCLWLTTGSSSVRSIRILEVKQNKQIIPLTIVLGGW